MVVYDNLMSILESTLQIQLLFSPEIFTKSLLNYLLVHHTRNDLIIFLRATISS